MVKKIPEKYVILFLIIVLLISTWGIYSNPRTVTKKDYDWDYFYLMESASRMSISEFGEFPLWNPYKCGGMVLFSHPDSKFFTPLFFLTLIFGEIISIKIEIMLMMILGIIGMYLLSKELKMSQTAGIVSTLIFTLSPHFMLRVVTGNPNWLTMLLLPLTIYLFLKRRYILVSLIITFIVFYGGSYNLLFFVLALGYVGIIFSKNKKKVIFWICMIITLSILLSAIKTVTFIDTLYLNNPRMYIKPQEASASILFDSLINRGTDPYKNDFVIPGLKYLKNKKTYFFVQYNSYIGLIPLVILLGGLIIFYKKLWPLLIALVLSSFYYLGNNTVINIYQLSRILPLFSSIRNQTSIGVLIIFFSAITIGKIITFAKKKFKIPRLTIILLIIIIALDLIIINTGILSGVFEKYINNQYPEEFKFPSYVNQSSKFGEYGQFLQNHGQIICYETYPIKSISKNIIDSVNIKGNPITRNSDLFRGDVYLINNETTEIVKYTPNSLEIRVNTTEETTLVVNQNYHKSWKSDRPVEKTNRGLISVRVTPEDKIIRLRFSPTSFWMGMWISIITAAAIITFFILKRYNEKAKKKMENINQKLNKLFEKK